jgi:hypothetical protein
MTPNLKCRRCGDPDISPGNVRNHTWLCRACVRKRYEAKREQIKAARRARYAANREQHSTLARDRRAAHPEKFSAQSRARYVADPEKFRARSRAWREANLERVRAYTMSVRGVARHLRGDHGLDDAASEHWARILTCPDTRCAICGIPGWKLPRLGYWKVGGARKNRRLSLDHVTPGMNDGRYRALCYSCNCTRGAAQFSDGEVLLIMRGWYRDMFALRRLYWLNSRVENGVCVGGREHRNEYMERKMAALRPER